MGPYLNVFLITQQRWNQSQVGLVTTIGGLLGLVVQTPIGAAIDDKLPYDDNVPARAKAKASVRPGRSVFAPEALSWKICRQPDLGKRIELKGRILFGRRYPGIADIWHGTSILSANSSGNLFVRKLIVNGPYRTLWRLAAKRSSADKLQRRLDTRSQRQSPCSCRCHGRCPG